MLNTEFVPAPQPSKSLTIVLHGLGDSIEGYRWLPSALRIPWMNYLLVNAPDDYYGGFSWYEYDGEPAPGIRRSRELLAELLNEQKARGFAVGEMTLFGFSQGCLMTLELALRFPERLAGLVGISGYVFEPEVLLKERSEVALTQRVLMTHGTEDPLIPIGRVREQVGLLQGAGVQIEWNEFAKAHTIDGERELKLIRSFIEQGYPERT